MNYINLLRQVASVLAEESEDRENHYKRIADNLSIQRDTNNFDRANYLAEVIHKNAGWGALFSVVFGDDAMLSNDGVDGLYEYVTEMHRGYIQNKSEHGHHRVTLFKNTLEGEPDWLKEEVAESAYNYYESTDPEYWDGETEQYVEFLEGYVER